MHRELKEVSEILEQDDVGDDGETLFATAIQALQRHQVIYDDTPGVRRDAIEFIKAHRGFFNAYFGVAGYRLRIEQREQMIALELPEGKTVYGWKQNRLKKDETLVRLALRYLLDQGWRHGDVDEFGRVKTHTDELFDLFINLKSEAPAASRLDEILRDLQRRGAIRIGDKDKMEKVTNLTILPGIRLYVPDSWIESVRSWLDVGLSDDVFALMAQQGEEDSTVAANTSPDAASEGDQATPLSADPDDRAALLL